MSASETTVLDVSGLAASRGDVEVLRDVSLTVSDELVTIFGLNASGKSTLLRTLSGLTRATRGSIRFEGVQLAGRPAHEVARAGLGFMPQTNQCFPTLTVAENLRLGGYMLPRLSVHSRQEELLEIFPVLAHRLGTPAGSLSGGERQMLSLARVLMARPRMLLLDEPSAGLSPTAIDMMWEKLRDLRQRRLTMLVVEQNIRAALRIADRALILRLGTCTAEIQVRDTAVDSAHIQRLLLGEGDGSATNSRGEG